MPYKKSTRASILASQFPEFNSDAIISFYLAEKPTKIHPKISLGHIKYWCGTVFGIKLDLLRLQDLLEYHKSRCDRMDTLSHPSIIDLSLFKIYAKSEDDAIRKYDIYNKSKTNNMITILNSNPEHRQNASKQVLIKRHGIDVGTKKYNDFILKQKKSSIRCVEYWITQGYTVDLAKTQVSKAQVTFSLDICVEKYGKELGYNIWSERQNKWQNTLNAKSDDEKVEINKRKNPFSIEKYINLGYTKAEAIDIISSKKQSHKFYSKEAIKFIESNIIVDVGDFYGDTEYFIYDINTKRRYFYDFMDKSKKIIFEYHGYAFHPNKKILTENDFSNWAHPFTKISAEEQYDFDQYKKSLAISHGFKYFYIFSNDSIDDIKAVITKLNIALNRS
jgi:hypothetical protein